MRSGIFRKVKPYLVALAIIAVVVTLVATIYFTQGNLPWIAFLSGILAASVLAEAARASRSEWVLMRRTAQLAAMKDKFEQESAHRRLAEAQASEDQHRLHLLDETLSTMIALVDVTGRCQYHNRAFREWLHLKSEAIAGRPLRELFGSKAYAGIATAVQKSLDGQALHYPLVQEMPGGAVYRLSVEHVPLLDASGKAAGFYWLADDITQRDDLSLMNPVIKSAAPVAQGVPVVQGVPEKSSAKSSERVDAGMQFISAIERDEFCLFCQLISPLIATPGKTAHYEILIRLIEEEGAMIPPGAFFPIAEKHGLMPYLDRWVVEHVLTWAASRTGRDQDSIFFLNVAKTTIADPAFPEFLLSALEEFGMPGSLLCFEVPQAALLTAGSHAAEFMRQIRQCGCRVALSGFGRNSVDEIHGLQLDFLKLDGGMILNMLSNPAELAKVISIERMAKEIGVQTVAELVESDEIVAKLGEIGINYAQGFGISRPRRLDE